MSHTSIVQLVLHTQPSPTPTSTLFPYTTLFRSHFGGLLRFDLQHLQDAVRLGLRDDVSLFWKCMVCGRTQTMHFQKRDRKSTRLNSSHRCISYDVFCLKKKQQST